VDDYANQSMTLRFAKGDSQAIAQTLNDVSTGVFDGIITRNMADEQVTEAGLTAAFEELARDIEPDDKFLLFVAGHGYTLDGTYYFVPQDFGTEQEGSIVRGIAQDKWQAWVDGIEAQASVMIFDTCESGTLVGTTRGDSDADAVAFNRLNYATGRSIISASTGTEAAAEGYRNHGLLTWVLLDALAKGDRNGDGLIDVGELANYAEENVPVISMSSFGVRQQPRKMIVADFPLARKAAPLP
jgi:uncharacterized caspase-like protein